MSVFVFSGYYETEEVKSSCTYPNEYDGPKPIKKQVRLLAEILGLDPTQALEYAKNLQELPLKAEGWFAIPSNDGLSKLFPKIKNDAERYCAGVRLVHERIAESRPFYNWYDTDETRIEPDDFQIGEDLAYGLGMIVRNQPGDILIVAAQLGMRHRGRSFNRAHAVRFLETTKVFEFGLGTLAVGSILLVHPKRIMREGDLDMCCIGETRGIGLDHQTHFYSSRSGQIQFGYDHCNNTSQGYGPVTAFV